MCTHIITNWGGGGLSGQDAVASRKGTGQHESLTKADVAGADRGHPRKAGPVAQIPGVGDQRA